MRAMVLHGFGRELVMEEVEEPPIGEDETLVKMQAAGVCATDLKVMSGSGPTPRFWPHILGHENAGLVVKVGKKVKQWKEGDRVTMYHRITCGICVNCRAGQENLCLRPQGELGLTLPGGFAEYVSAPAKNLVKLPDPIPFDQGSIAPGATAAAFHGIRLAGNLVGQTVSLIGVGGLGLGALQIIKGMGARVIAVDIISGNLGVAKILGADDIINAAECDVVSEVKRLTDDVGADAVFEFSGSPKALQTALKSVKLGGKVVVVGYSYKDQQVQSADFTNTHVTVLGSRSYTYLDLLNTVRLIERGIVKPIVAATYPLQDANNVLGVIAKGAIPGRAVLDLTM